jgi:hypothetical protein
MGCGYFLLLVYNKDAMYGTYNDHAAVMLQSITQLLSSPPQEMTKSTKATDARNPPKGERKNAMNQTFPQTFMQPHDGNTYLHY